MKTTLLASVFTALMATTALAQPAAGPKSIHTGGTAGAYHTTFCPSLPGVLSNAYFQGYSCTPSQGTVDNIKRVQTYPSSIGFVQLDVYAREAATRAEEFKKLQVIRSDIACEGLWMITKNPDLDFGKILGLARRIRFILPGEGSGSTASFRYLQSIDPDGLGRVNPSNVTYARDATEVLNRVAASTEGEVGFFVQFADPNNANIKLIVEKKLRVIPVVSREILNAKVGNTPVYQAQEFNMTADGFISSGVKVTTSCTPVALITGSPEAFNDRNGKDDAAELAQKVAGIPAAKLLPQDDRLARLISGARRLGSATVAEMTAAVDAARKAVENR